MAHSTHRNTRSSDRTFSTWQVTLFAFILLNEWWLSLAFFSIPMAGYACNALSYSNCVSLYYNMYEYSWGPGAPLNNMSTLKSFPPCGAIYSKHLVCSFFYLSKWENLQLQKLFTLPLLPGALSRPHSQCNHASYKIHILCQLCFVGKEIAAGITFIAKVFSSEGSLTFLYSIEDTGKRLGW